MRDLPLRGQRCEKDWSGPEGHWQARNFYGKQQQGDRRIAEDLDRERRLVDAPVQGSSRSAADQRCGGLRPHAVIIKLVLRGVAPAAQKKNSPRGLIIDRRGLELRKTTGYLRIASLKAFEGRKRTTVFALILIASPVCGLRPMRALRCAFTTRPMPGMTNLPAPPLDSLTASLNSSSKNKAAVFFGEPIFSAMWDTIFVLLKGLAAI